MKCATHFVLGPMSRVRHQNECMQVRENVTCEGVLFTPSVGCSRLLSAVNDLTTTTK